MTAEEIERIADAVVDRLPAGSSGRWVTAAEVAEHLSVDVAFVYEHAERLGAARLGGGSKARLRFRLADVDAAICVGSRASAGSPTAADAGSRRKARRRMGTGAELLPIRGREVAP